MATTKTTKTEKTFPIVHKADADTEKLSVAYEIEIVDGLTIDGCFKVTQTLIRRQQALASPSGSDESRVRRGFNFLNALITEDNVLKIEDFYLEQGEDVPESVWETVFSLFGETIIPKALKQD